MKNLIATSAAALVLSAGIASAAPRAGTPFEFPINATSIDQGTFSGTFKVERFAVDNGALVASGSVIGTLIDETGATMAIYRTVTIPVQLPNAARGAKAADAAPLGCDVLHLVLGPLHLDLLGLVVDLNTVVLDIDAEPGAGNLLGNLLCAIVGLLDGSNLGLLSQLLNQLLGLLG